jgi:hypothetical protein
MQAVDYSRLKPVRDYVQDIAKILGKLQQGYLAPDPNDWFRGLDITENGISTQDLGDGRRIVLDMWAGQIRTPTSTFSITPYTAQQVLEKLQDWLAAHSTTILIPQPEFVTAEPHFESIAANTLVGILSWGHDQLMTTKSGLTTGVTSPVLLYPHHFDVGFAWYPDGKTAADTDKPQQYTVGLSAGDAYIAEPYLYVTQYPEQADFPSRSLPQPAYFHTAGFSGAILRYNDAVHSDQPDKLAQDFFRAALKSQ